MYFQLKLELRIVLSVKNSISCKHRKVPKRIELWEEGKKGDFLFLPSPPPPFLRLPCRLSLQLQPRLCEFGETFCGGASNQLEKVTFPRWMETPPPKFPPRIRKGELACGNASYMRIWADSRPSVIAGNYHFDTDKEATCMYLFRSRHFGENERN